MIKVWVTDINAYGNITRLQLNTLDFADEERAMRIRSGEDRRRFLIGRILLRQALSQTFGNQPGSWSFIIGMTGKVNLAYGRDVPFVDFNISHSGDALAVAISTSGRVGIDIETKDPLKFQTPVDIAFTDRELQHLQEESESTRWLETLRFWTMKEAYAKLLGMGVQIDFSSFEVWPSTPKAFFDTRDIKLGPHEYVLSIASSRNSEESEAHLAPLVTLTDLGKAKIHPEHLALPQWVGFY